jgi:zinc protease
VSTRGRGADPARRAARTCAAAALAAWLLAAGPAGAAALAEREVLPNGLVLLVAERPAIPVVVARLFLRAGAVFDPPDRAGLAHLTGALLTRGAGARTAREIDEAVEFVGGQLEAGAGRDVLTVSLGVLRRDLGLGLDLLADVVLRPTFPEAEVRRTVKEVQAALQRAEENPETVAARTLARRLFAGHPYGRPVEGARESLERVTRDDVVAFWRRHARPDTAGLVVVGAVRREEVRREVLARFGSWRPPAAPPPTGPPLPAPTPPGRETVTRELAQTTLLLGRQAVNQTHPDYFPLAVASWILGGGSSSRLYERVRDQGGLAYAVFSHLAPGQYGATLTVSAQTRHAEVGRVLQIIREELARLGREPVSPRDLDVARSYLTGSFPLRLDTSAKVADFLAAVEYLGLGLDYPDRYRQRIARVTAADVQRVAAQYLAPATFHEVIVGQPP